VACLERGISGTGLQTAVVTAQVPIRLQQLLSLGFFVQQQILGLMQLMRQSVRVNKLKQSPNSKKLVLQFPLEVFLVADCGQELTEIRLDQSTQPE
jgi:hypothetical protein